MQCPIDQTTLAMTERQGIEIDYCPTCRGVWLDRGELDKLIDAGSASQAANVRLNQPSMGPEQPRYEDRSRSRDIHSSDDQYYKHGKRKKKEGFLSDLFDF